LELQEFIRQTLFEITEGVREANQRYKEARQSSENAFVLRPGSGKEKEEGAGIHFDVAVTTKAGTGTGGEARVGIKVVELSAGRESQQAKESVSRIRFTVVIHHFIG